MKTYYLILLIFLSGSCLFAQDPNRFHGGSYDGTATFNISLALLNGNTPNTDKYFGGSYDGFTLNDISLALLNGNVPNTDKYFGGSYDGIALNDILLAMLNGSSPNTDKYFGGGYDGASQFHISQTPLPIHLLSFTSNVTKNNVELKWTTGSEMNNKGFSVQRAISSDSPEWSEVGFVNGSGNTNKPVDYTFKDRKLNTGNYDYRLKQMDFNGNHNFHDLGNVVEIGAPSSFTMSDNYPNPFNPMTKIDYELPVDGEVNIIIFDITGREIATLVKEKKRAGYYTLKFDGSSIASGMYFYRIIAEGSGDKFMQTKKMLLIK